MLKVREKCTLVLIWKIATVHTSIITTIIVASEKVEQQVGVILKILTNSQMKSEGVFIDMGMYRDITSNSNSTN